MPPKRSKKMLAKKCSSISSRKISTKFPTAKIVSLNLAKCIRKSLIDMQRRNETAKKRQNKFIEYENEDINKGDKECVEDNDLPSTSNIAKTGNLPIVAKQIKKKIKRRKGIDTKCFSIGRQFIKIFKYVSRLGDTYAASNTITYPKTLWWLKEAQILDNHRVTIRDVEVHFINQLKSGYDLNILEFIRFIKSLCNDRGLQMSAVLMKLINFQENKKAMCNKSCVVYKEKLIRGYKLNSAYKKKVTSCHARENHQIKEISNISMLGSKNRDSCKTLDTVPNPQSSAELTNGNIANMKDRNKMESSSGPHLELPINRISLIPFYNTNTLLKHIALSVLLQSKGSSKENFDLQCLKSDTDDKIAAQSKQLFHSGSVNLNGIDSCPLGRDLKKLRIKGDSFENIFEEERYEYISPQTSMNNILQRETSINMVTHPKRSPCKFILSELSLKGLRCSAASVEERCEFPNSNEHVPKVRGKKTQMPKVENLVGRKENSNHNMIKKISTLKEMDEIYCLQHASDQKKDEANFRSYKKLNNSLFSRKEKNLSSFTNSSNTNSSIRILSPSIGKGFAEHKRKNTSDKIETAKAKDISFGKTNEPKHRLQNSSTESRMSPTRNKLNVPKREDESPLKKDTKFQGTKNNSQQVKTKATRREKKVRRTFSNLPARHVQKVLSGSGKSKTKNVTTITGNSKCDSNSSKGTNSKMKCNLDVKQRKLADCKESKSDAIDDTSDEIKSKDDAENTSFTYNDTAQGSSEVFTLVNSENKTLKDIEIKSKDDAENTSFSYNDTVQGSSEVFTLVNSENTTFNENH